MTRSTSLPVLNAPTAPCWQRAGVLALVAGGAVAWKRMGRNPWWIEKMPQPNRWTLITLAVVTILAMLPVVHRATAGLLDKLRHPSNLARRLTMLLIVAAGGAYLAFTAFHQHRVLGPQWHDEHSYLIQMRMLAEGRLWIPRHPIGQFFESFHMLVDPVYASKYFPGASILFLPTLWLHLPYWVMPVIISSLALAMTYRVVAELVDGAAGILAAIMLISLLKFRMLSTMTLSQIPLLLLALLTVWAWLHWRQKRSTVRAISIGIFAGFAMLTRPLDTLCYVGPIGLAMLFDMTGLPMRRRVTIVGLVLLGAAPFLAIQLACNKGITGSWTSTPWEKYSRHSDPWDTVGKPKSDPEQTLSTLPQVVKYREEVSRVFAQRKLGEGVIHSIRSWRIGLVLNRILPATVLLALMPAALFGLCDRRRLVLAATLPLMILAYSFHTAFNEYYFVAVAPAALMLVLLGTRQLEAVLPRFRSTVATVMTFAILTFCLFALPEVTAAEDQFLPHTADSPAAYEKDEFWQHDIFPKVNAAIAKLEHTPAVVLFRFDPARRLDAEPVYNIDVARPDDAPVIRANDMPDNSPIFRYYGERQPNRAFYRYDEATDAMQYLGTAKDLASSSR